jgi:Raf kinase inhibitor-like YbhB/YbcL family protein
MNFQNAITGGEVNYSTSLCVTISFSALLCACAPQTIQQQVNGALQVNSSTVAGGAIPDKCGCKGPGSSPQLSWSDPPAGTQSFALVMEDREGPVGHLHRHYFVHWLAFDLPADKRELSEALPREPLADGTQQGKNDVGQFGYSGPCPDAGSTHHYAFTVYALDKKLGLPVDTKGRQLLTAIDGHILARGQIVATYKN